MSTRTQSAKRRHAKSTSKDIQDRAFRFACRIVKLGRFLARQKGAAEITARQILRSGTSIGANLEEASAACSKPDFTAECTISLKEARETHYWLRLFRDTHLVPESRIEPLIEEANELIAVITTIVKNARGRT
jgi:four helix bundle protein